MAMLSQNIDRIIVLLQCRSHTLVDDSMSVSIKLKWKYILYVYVGRAKKRTLPKWFC